MHLSTNCVFCVFGTFFFGNPAANALRVRQCTACWAMHCVLDNAHHEWEPCFGKHPLDRMTLPDPRNPKYTVRTHTGADPVAALLLAAPAAGPVSLSVINGRVVVRDGEILGFDLPALVAQGEARSARLVSMLTPAAIGAGTV